MPQEINFLAKQQEIHQARTKVDLKATYAMFALGIATLGIYALAWFVNFRFKSKISAATRETTRLKETITQKEQEEIQYLIFYEKLERLHELLAAREGGVAAIKNTYDYFVTTPGLTLIRSEYDYYERQLSFVVKADSVFSVADVIQLLQADEFRNAYPNSTIANLNRSSNGNYQFSIIVDLDENVSSPDENTTVAASDDLNIDIESSYI